MKAGKPLAFILLAFVIGATVSQGSFAFADDSSTNPFRAIWDAIGELQFKTESLQAQIDELKSQQGTVSAAQTVTKNSEASLAIDVTAGQSGQTLMTLIVRNAGPDSAVGVKLTTFYQRSLFQVNFVQGAECSDGSRGIIECYLGTVVAGSEARVVVDATPISIGQQAIITADLSSITTDLNLVNNHAEAVFVTSVAPVAQPAPSPAPSEVPAAPTEQSSEQSAPEQTEGEQISEEQSGEQASEQQPTEEQSTEQPSEQISESSEQAGTGEESSSEASGEQGEGGADSGTSENASDGGAEGGASSDNGSTGDAGSGGESSGGDAGAGDGGDASSDSGSSGTDSGSGDGGGSGDSGAGGEGGSSGDSGSGGDGGSSGEGASTG